MLAYRELVSGLENLGITPGAPVIAHASLKAFGEVRGGAEMFVGALAAVFSRVMMPAFTYKTMLVPETGPDRNGIKYGSGRSQNKMAQFYSASMPADKMMGVIPETLRSHPDALRSEHPILSFAGIGLPGPLRQQTLYEPLEPVGALEKMGGWVLLLGVDHTTNTSLHYAEKLAGRKQFIRWALTPQGVQAAPNFPGCSNGFHGFNELLAPVTRQTRIGNTVVQALPLVDMIQIARQAVIKKPLGYLCSLLDCPRCNAVRGETWERRAGPA